MEIKKEIEKIIEYQNASLLIYAIFNLISTHHYNDQFHAGLSGQSNL